MNHFSLISPPDFAARVTTTAPEASSSSATVRGPKAVSRAGRKLTAGAAALLCVGALAGCGLQPATSYVPTSAPGSITPIEGLGEDAEMTVASKNFTEQLILGKIAVLTGQAAGFNVTDFTNIPGSQPTREIMASHKADVTYEYTGTAWIAYMGNSKGIPDKAEQWQAVHDADQANGLIWGKPAPLNNTYAFAISEDKAQELGVTKLSQIKDLPVKERTLCVESEFNSRPDGLNPMLKAYDLPRGSSAGIPDENIGVYDTGAVYTATASGDCNFGEVFTTDGRIDSLKLRVLEDDRKFFPAYNAAPVFNAALLDQHPQLEEIYSQVSSKLTDETMRQLNLRVDQNGEEPSDVAFDWMVQEGFIKPAHD